MSSPSIRIKRAATETGRFAVSTGAPSTLSHGELAVLFPDPASATPSSLGETVYVGAADGTAVAVGGSGTFATRQYVDNKVTSVFIYKGKITSFFAPSGASFPLNLASLSQSTGSYYSIDFDYPGNPLNDDPGTVGTDKNAVAVGWVEGALPGALAGAYDNGLSYGENAVVYYQVGAAAPALYYRSGNFNNPGYTPEATANASWTPVTGATFKTLIVKSGDSIVKTASAWEKFDNVDVEVYGTASEIAVTGDENSGYTVAIDSAFSGRLSTAEGDIDDLETKTQNIDLAETTAGTTKINGQVDIGSGLSVASTTTLSDKLTISSGGFGVTGDSTLTGDFSVTGDIAVSGDLAITTDLDVTGNADIGTDLTVVGASSLGGGATVTGGNLTGSGTNQITDFIIDGGVF